MDLVPPSDNSNDKRLPESVMRITSSTETLKTLKVGSVLHGQILARLALGKASGTELATMICDCPDGKPVPRAQYMRVVRALSVLERRGYVAKALFGNDKPYYLTKYGQEMVTAISGGGLPGPLITHRDLVYYGTAVSAATVSYALTRVQAGSTVLAVCWIGTGVTIGVCLTRFVQMLRRIL